jgi:hypothetical protein
MHPALQKWCGARIANIRCSSVLGGAAMYVASPSRMSRVVRTYRTWPGHHAGTDRRRPAFRRNSPCSFPQLLACSLTPASAAGAPTRCARSALPKTPVCSKHRYAGTTRMLRRNSPSCNGAVAGRAGFRHLLGAPGSRSAHARHAPAARGVPSSRRSPRSDAGARLRVHLL